MYRKLKRVWSHNDMNFIPRFYDTFPELRNVSTEDLCDRWINLGLDYYTQKPEPVQPWIRLTLPFAIILMILMFIMIPVVFLFTGNWGYNISKNPRIYNWFKSLRLLS